MADLDRRADRAARESQLLIDELAWLLKRLELSQARALLASAARKIGWDPRELLDARKLDR